MPRCTRATASQHAQLGRRDALRRHADLADQPAGDAAAPRIGQEIGAQLGGEVVDGQRGRLRRLHVGDVVTAARHDVQARGACHTNERGAVAPELVDRLLDDRAAAGGGVEG